MKKLSAIGFLFFSLTASSSVILDGKLDNSRIFPGTVHIYKISVPDGYNPQDSACLYLGLDGILCNAPNVIDTLIAQGDMPMTIGVYLNPGVVYGADGKTPLRYNRSNEFDATDGRFAEFISTELIPDIKKHITPDGRKINLKEGGNNSAIFGLSSGGIAAFNAAWHRPDLFGRVFSGCGTFVPMRGGNQLEAIVRKHEPKPLRIFLQDGYEDTWNPIFGSWYEHNRMLASALEFAGYDCGFDWAEGGHSVARSSKIFKEVMQWLWRDYPEPIERGTTNNNFLRPLLDSCSPEWVKQEGSFIHEKSSEGIFNADTTLYFSTVPGTNFMDQYIVNPATKELSNGQRYYYLHSYNNSELTKASMAFDDKGNLWVLTEAGIQILDQNGRVRGILNLPDDLNSKINDNIQLVLKEGTVEIITPGARYERKINSAPAVSGVSPVSQGPA